MNDVNDEVLILGMVVGFTVGYFFCIIFEMIKDFIRLVVFGYPRWMFTNPPAPLNEVYANSVATRCAAKFVKQYSEAHDLTPQQNELLTAHMHEFCKHVIVSYLRQPELPEVDLLPTPVSAVMWQDEETKQLVAKIQ